ncbi:MAG: FAD-dependent oxidoreductase [Pseudomonadota bacterium]
MRNAARVVIVGGGVSGLSALYHLMLEGWTDVVLLERNELTSGTTWHSAAQCPQLAFNQLLLLLRQYTIGLYKTLADDPDHPINYHHRTGGLRLLTDRNDVDAAHHILSVAKGVGIDFELLDPTEAVRRNPLLNPEGLRAALCDELDGDIDPAQLCQALARRARAAGAEIHRHCPATGFTQKPNSEWVVHTEQGDIAAEHVVIAAGYRVNEVGDMLGIRYPVIAMEHMYFVTEDIPALVERDGRVPMVRCPRDTFYLRQEKHGLLVGIYEHDCQTFGMDGIDPDFVNALCANDLDRLLPKMEPIFDRLPCLQDVGIRAVVNGPIAYAADAGPLVGRQPGWRNLWSMNGIRVGIGEGGGYGKMLAQQLVHGETEWDTWQLDPRRITHYANTEFTALKAIEDYQREFQWHLPHEHRPAGRPAKTTPLYPVLQARGAEFGVVNGWERTEFYKPTPDFVAEHGYAFGNWHPVVAAEVAAVQSHVGIAELSGFNRFEITGTDAAAWLDSLSCSRVPRAPGRVGLCYFLSDNGNIDAEATVVSLGPDRLWYCSAAAAEYHDRDWLTERLPADSDVNIASLTNSHTVLVIAGPAARALMDMACPRTGFAQAAFPWMTARRCTVGHVEAVVMAVSFSGEQAFEVHVENTQLYAAYLALTEAGKAHRLTHFGMHAIESMRLEKGYGHWKADFITEFNPMEAGLERFVDLSKTFPGKGGLQRQMALGNRRNRVLIAIDSTAAPAHAGETVFDGDRPVGTITSTAWGHRVQKNLAMAYVDPHVAQVGTELHVSLIGVDTAATVVEPCLYDAEHAIPRGRA